MVAPTRNSTKATVLKRIRLIYHLESLARFFEACPNPLLHETNHTLAPMGETRNKLFTHFRTSPSQSINVRTTFYAVMITVHGICWSNVSLGTCLYLKAFKLEVGSVLKSDKYHSNVQSLERRVLTAQNLQSTISSAEHKRVSSFPPIEIGLRFLSSYNSDFFFKTKLDLIWNFCPPKFTQ